MKKCFEEYANIIQTLIGEKDRKITIDDLTPVTVKDCSSFWFKEVPHIVSTYWQEGLMRREWMDKLSPQFYGPHLDTLKEYQYEWNRSEDLLAQFLRDFKPRRLVEGVQNLD